MYNFGLSTSSESNLARTSRRMNRWTSSPKADADRLARERKICQKEHPAAVHLLQRRLKMGHYLGPSTYCAAPRDSLCLLCCQVLSPEEGEQSSSALGHTSGALETLSSRMPHLRSRTVAKGFIKEAFGVALLPSELWRPPPPPRSLFVRTRKKHNIKGTERTPKMPL